MVVYDETGGALDRALFEKLAHDPHENVRRAIAYNRKTPPEILALLAKDKEELVSSPAKTRMQSK